MLITESEEIVSREAEDEKHFDPYLYRAEMPFTGVYYPMGFPLELATNSEEVLEAAEESWGVFTPRFEIPPVRLKIGVLEDGSTECPPAPGFRAQRNIMVRIADQDNFYVADLIKGFSFAWLTAAAVSHRSYMRYHFLESAALCHIANRHTAPIHGACVELNGRGVLLCGDSGAGKSSLSFACARAGWTYISDDASFLIQGRQDRQVVGNCHVIRLRPSAAELFEEVAGKPITPRTVGKPSIELRTSTIPGIKPAATSEVDYVVFLDRGARNIQELVPFPKESARQYMLKHLCGMDELRRNQIASVDRLLTADVFELRYNDLNWAIDRLERMVQERR